MNLFDREREIIKQLERYVTKHLSQLITQVIKVRHLLVGRDQSFMSVAKSQSFTKIVQ